MSPLKVAASICILDSLAGGMSRFYAEIHRLKLIADLAQGPVPVLFLLDELLSGTNSHDRLIGAQFVIEHLLEHGAVGIASTHDLALAQIPARFGETGRQFSFRGPAGRRSIGLRLQAEAGNCADQQRIEADARDRTGSYKLS